MSARSEVLIDVVRLPDALAAGAQLLDVRWHLGEAPGTGHREFTEGHIPGARFLDMENVLTGPTTDPTLGRHPLPDAARLEAGLGALGIDAGRPIVVYDLPTAFVAGRAWWVLRWVGLDVRVLDGGLPAWVAAGGELESGDPEPPEPTPLHLTTGQLPTIYADEAARFDGVLIDVRAAERYRGEVEPIDRVAGHVPGAVNRPVAGFCDATGHLAPAADLDALLDLPLNAPVAVYCGSGVSAGQAVLALASLGIEAALYPPAWSGWSADPSRPVATGSEP
ncbi:MAG: sulfurtransferase [Propionibacteriaceae bacterium]|nr:sulfurtransferase [Propionibacteriaceae bacterium]